jgi:hypothetical protein
MAEKKPAKARTRIAKRAGKAPSAAIKTTLASSKYRSGGAKPRAKQGGIIRKVAAPIRYKKAK